jgi:hypothetical protein
MPSPATPAVAAPAKRAGAPRAKGAAGFQKPLDFHESLRTIQRLLAAV